MQQPQNFPQKLPDGVVKKSILNFITFIVGTICFIGAICFFIGIVVLDFGITNYFKKNNLDSQLDILRGIIFIGLSLILFFGSYWYIISSIKKKEWWRELD